jgi:hypothetical protein
MVPEIRQTSWTAKVLSVLTGVGALALAVVLGTFLLGMLLALALFGSAYLWWRGRRPMGRMGDAEGQVIEGSYRVIRAGGDRGRGSQSPRGQDRSTG